MPTSTLTQAYVTERQASEVTQLTVEQLRRLVADRESCKVARAAIPAPLSGPPYVFAEAAFYRWARRMGMTTFEDVAVIGYTGMAVLLGMKEQSLRKLAMNRARHEAEGGAWPQDLPRPLFEYQPGDPDYQHSGARVLFAIDAIQRWGRQTGRLRD